MAGFQFKNPFKGVFTKAKAAVSKGWDRFKQGVVTPKENVKESAQTGGLPKEKKGYQSSNYAEGRRAYIAMGITAVVFALIAGLVAGLVFFASPLIIFAAVVLGLLAPFGLYALWLGAKKFYEWVKTYPTVVLGLLGITTLLLLTFLAPFAAFGVAALGSILLGSTIVVLALVAGWAIEQKGLKKEVSTAQIAMFILSIGVIMALGLSLFGAPLAALIGVSLPVLGLIGFAVVPVIYVGLLGLKESVSNPKTFLGVILGTALLVGSFLLPLLFPAFFGAVFFGAPVVMLLSIPMFLFGIGSWIYAFANKNKGSKTVLFGLFALLVAISAVMTFGAMPFIGFGGLFLGGTLGLAALATVIVVSIVVGMMAMYTFFQQLKKSPSAAFMALGTLFSISAMVLFLLGTAGFMPLLPISAFATLFALGLAFSLPYLVMNLKEGKNRIALLLSLGLSCALIMVLFTPLALLIAPGILGVSILVGGAVLAPLALYHLVKGIVTNPRTSAAVFGGLLLVGTTLLFFLAAPSLVVLALMFTLGAALFMTGLITGWINRGVKWRELSTAKKVGVLLLVGLIPAIGFMLFGGALGIAAFGAGGVLILGGLVLIAPAVLYGLGRLAIYTVNIVYERLKRIAEWIRTNPNATMAIAGIALMGLPWLLMLASPAFLPLCLFFSGAGLFLTIFSVWNKAVDFFQKYGPYIGVGVMVLGMGLLVMLMAVGLVSVGAVIAAGFLLPFLGLVIARLKKAELTFRERLALALVTGLLVGTALIFALVFVAGMTWGTAFAVIGVIAAVPLIIVVAYEAYKILVRRIEKLQKNSVAVFTVLSVLTAGVAVALMVLAGPAMLVVALPLLVVTPFLMMIGFLIQRGPDGERLPLTVRQKAALAMGAVLVVAAAVFVLGGGLILMAALAAATLLVSAIVSNFKQIRENPVATGVVIGLVAVAAIGILPFFLLGLVLGPFMMAVLVVTAFLLPLLIGLMVSPKYGPEIIAFAKALPLAVGLIAATALTLLLAAFSPLLIPLMLGSTVLFALTTATIAFILLAIGFSLQKFSTIGSSNAPQNKIVSFVRFVGQRSKKAGSELQKAQRIDQQTPEGPKIEMTVPQQRLATPAAAKDTPHREAAKKPEAVLPAADPMNTMQRENLATKPTEQPASAKPQPAEQSSAPVMVPIAKTASPPVPLVSPAVVAKPEPVNNNKPKDLNVYKRKDTPSPSQSHDFSANSAKTPSPSLGSRAWSGLKAIGSAFMNATRRQLAKRATDEEAAATSAQAQSGTGFTAAPTQPS